MNQRVERDHPEEEGWRSPEGDLYVYMCIIGRRVTTTVFYNGPVPPHTACQAKSDTPLKNDIWLLVTTAEEK